MMRKVFIQFLMCLGYTNEITNKIHDFTNNLQTALFKERSGNDHSALGKP